jgi:hypothetical protein
VYSLDQLSATISQMERAGDLYRPKAGYLKLTHSQDDTD